MSKNSNPKVFISTSSFGEHDTAPLKHLEKASIQFTVNPHGRKLTEEEIADFLSDGKFQGLIAGTEPLTRSVLDRATDLKVISRVGVGLENVDLEAAHKKGIQVFNTPEPLVDSVSELTIALMLNCLRKIAPQNAKIKNGVWKKEMGNLLKGKKIGLIGFGRIGQRVGQLCMAFGTTVFYYDIQEATNNPCKLITFEELVTQSDVISLHLSGANQVLTSLEFEQMKKGVVIINTSRGSAIDETALANQLKSGKVGFAALDVFSNEPYRGELTQLDNVILTPHIGSYALESRVKMEIQSAEQLIQFLERSHNS